MLKFEVSPNAYARLTAIANNERRDNARHLSTVAHRAMRRLVGMVERYGTATVGISLSCQPRDRAVFANLPDGAGYVCKALGIAHSDLLEHALSTYNPRAAA